jgi:RNA 3'-phosphate cyclase
MGKLCNAEIKGLNIGSSNLEFYPREIIEGNYKFDIGTAGSITLVFQASILCLLNIKKPVTITLRGGTDVKWSPSWDYFKYVFIPLINKMKLFVDARLIRRGYYPKGEGEAILTVNPCKGIQILKSDIKQKFSKVNGIINYANLPDHICKRMKHSTIKILVKNNLESSIIIEKATSYSAGTGITLWAQTKENILGATVIGEKGLPAEKMGEKVAYDIIKEIDSGSTIDVHAFDQIIPYMILANNEKQSFCIVREISSHAKTNLWLINQFFKEKDIINISDKRDHKIIKVNGLNFL